MKKIALANRTSKSINVTFEPYTYNFDLQKGATVEFIGYNQKTDSFFHVEVLNDDKYIVWLNGFESVEYRIINEGE